MRAKLRCITLQRQSHPTGPAPAFGTDPFDERASQRHQQADHFALLGIQSTHVDRQVARERDSAAHHFDVAQMLVFSKSTARHLDARLDEEQRFTKFASRVVITSQGVPQSVGKDCWADRYLRWLRPRESPFRFGWSPNTHGIH